MIALQSEAIHHSLSYLSSFRFFFFFFNLVGVLFPWTLIYRAIKNACNNDQTQVTAWHWRRHCCYAGIGQRRPSTFFSRPCVKLFFSRVRKVRLKMPGIFSWKFQCAHVCSVFLWVVSLWICTFRKFIKCSSQKANSEAPCWYWVLTVLLID